MSRFDDIINLPHHVSSKRKPMSMENRAAQFAPFAALTGHSDAINETARLTSPRIRLSDVELQELNRRLELAVRLRASVTVSYFQPDNLKAGGKYLTVNGVIKKINAYDNCIMFSDKTFVPLADILTIDGTIFNDFDA